MASPGFIEVFPYTPASITLAYIAALLTEADYDTAEKLLESYDTAREPQQSPIWRCLGATLHYVTQRWTDVLDWTARPVSGTAPVVDAATDLMAGIAHVGLGEFDPALDLLSRIPSHQVSPAPPPTPPSIAGWRYAAWAARATPVSNWAKPASTAGYYRKPAAPWLTPPTGRSSRRPRLSPRGPVAGIRRPDPAPMSCATSNKPRPPRPSSRRLIVTWNLTSAWAG